MKNTFIMRRRNKTAIAVLAGLFLIALAYGYNCGLQKTCGVEIVEKAVRGKKEIELPQGRVYAEVVDTPQSRAQGLSGRASLAQDEAMLFVFDHPGKYGFWMKDMLFPIDIVWISEDGIVVHVEHNVSPSSYFTTNPPQTYINKPDAMYVLELASGQAEKYGLYLGTKVKMGE